MHQTKKGNQWYCGMKAHIGVDEVTGLVHRVVTTAANVGDVTQVGNLMHGKENVVLGDAGYIVAAKHAPASHGRKWHIAAKRSKVKAIEDETLRDLTEQIGHIKACGPTEVLRLQTRVDQTTPRLPDAIYATLREVSALP